MAQTNINIRMDENLKQQFDWLCSELGLNMTTAINIFAKPWCASKKYHLKLPLMSPTLKPLLRLMM